MNREINEEVVCCDKRPHKGKRIWQSMPINKNGNLLRGFQIYMNTEKTDIVENGYCSYCFQESKFPDMKHVANTFILTERIIALLIEGLPEYEYFIHYEIACYFDYINSNCLEVYLNFWNKKIDKKDIKFLFVFDFENKNIMYFNKKFSSEEIKDLTKEMLNVIINK